MKRNKTAKKIISFIITLAIVIALFPANMAKAACSHTFRWEVIEEETCTKNGTQVYRCSKCKALGMGANSYQAIPKGHKYQWTEVTHAGWTTPGEQQQKCTRCNAVGSKKTIPCLVDQLKSDPSYAYKNIVFATTTKVADSGSNRHGFLNDIAPDEKPYDPGYGDIPGDQTGTEYQVRDWYQATSNGKVLIAVFRYNGNPEVALKLATLSIDAANNNLIGYTMGAKRGESDPNYSTYSRDYKGKQRRWQYLKTLRSSGYNPAAIISESDQDCSAGVAANIIATGWHMGDGYLFSFAGHDGYNDTNGVTTKNITQWLGTTGRFTCYTNAGYKGVLKKYFANDSFYKIDATMLTSSQKLLPGDILLYAIIKNGKIDAGHVNVCVTVGSGYTK